MADEHITPKEAKSLRDICIKELKKIGVPHLKGKFKPSSTPELIDHREAIEKIAITLAPYRPVEAKVLALKLANYDAAEEMSRKYGVMDSTTIVRTASQRDHRDRTLVKMCYRVRGEPELISDLSTWINKDSPYRKQADLAQPIECVEKSHAFVDLALEKIKQGKFEAYVNKRNLLDKVKAYTSVLRALEDNGYIDPKESRI